jgi:hypothetical protein
MDPLERTSELIKRTELPFARISAETGVSINLLYRMKNMDGSKFTYHRVKSVYEYLSGRKLEV